MTSGNWRVGGWSRILLLQLPINVLARSNAGHAYMLCVCAYSAYILYIFTYMQICGVVATLNVHTQTAGHKWIFASAWNLCGTRMRPSSAASPIYLLPRLADLRCVFCILLILCQVPTFNWSFLAPFCLKLLFVSNVSELLSQSVCLIQCLMASGRDVDCGGENWFQLATLASTKKVGFCEKTFVAHFRQSGWTTE